MNLQQTSTILKHLIQVQVHLYRLIFCSSLITNFKCSKKSSYNHLLHYKSSKSMKTFNQTMIHLFSLTLCKDQMSISDEKRFATKLKQLSHEKHEFSLYYHLKKELYR